MAPSPNSDSLKFRFCWVYPKVCQKCDNQMNNHADIELDWGQLANLKFGQKKMVGPYADSFELSYTTCSCSP